MLHVYITDLQAYNEGHLVGRWIELPVTRIELSTVIEEVLNEGEAISGSYNHEELFITDYEWDIYSMFDVDENINIIDLNDIVCDLDLKTDYELKVLSFLFQEGIALDITDAMSKINDVVIHENQDMKDVAYELLNDCYDLDSIAPIIANNIDYESIAKELQASASYWEVGYDIYEYLG